MTYEELTQIVAKYSDLCKCPELKENPFRKRICKVFSVDDSGNLTFDQFVYLFSVFSEKAPREMKVQFAFKIYGNFFNFLTFLFIISKLLVSDFDGDGFIGATDIENAVKLLTQNELNHEEIESVWEKVLAEGDIDDDKRLSANEFSHVITKSPDFMATFHFGI